MLMRCAACNRSLLSPAYTAPAGWVLGKKCAKKVGKGKPRKACKRAGKVARVEQLDLFDGPEFAPSKVSICLTV